MRVNRICSIHKLSENNSRQEWSLDGATLGCRPHAAERGGVNVRPAFACEAEPTMGPIANRLSPTGYLDMGYRDGPVEPVKAVNSTDALISDSDLKLFSSKMATKNISKEFISQSDDSELSDDNGIVIGFGDSDNSARTRPSDPGLESKSKKSVSRSTDDQSSGSETSKKDKKSTQSHSCRKKKCADCGRSYKHKKSDKDRQERSHSKPGDCPAGSTASRSDPHPDPTEKPTKMQTSPGSDLPTGLFKRPNPVTTSAEEFEKHTLTSAVVVSPSSGRPVAGSGSTSGVSGSVTLQQKQKETVSEKHASGDKLSSGVQKFASVVKSGVGQKSTPGASQIPMPVIKSVVSQKSTPVMPVTVSQVLTSRADQKLTPTVEQNPTPIGQSPVGKNPSNAGCHHTVVYFHG